MITPGKYLAVAKGSDILTAKSGNKQVIVDFEIIEGEHTGQRIYWSGTFTEKAEEMAIRALLTMGWEGSDLSELSKVDDIAAPSILPSQVILVTEVEEGTKDNGEKYQRARVKFVNPVGGARMNFENGLTGTELKMFGASYKSRIDAMRAAGPKFGNSKPAQPKKAGDDLPF